MPDRPHHTEKMHRCVEHVTAQGNDEDSAWAICTATMQKAGEPIYENASAGSAEELRFLASEAPETTRQVHLRGALGKVRTETYNGREHLVVPVVALMEGVIHPVNADTPEKVSADVLSRAAASWNGRPLMLKHPVLNGRAVSANEPGVLDMQGFGTIFNSRMQGTKLLMDAYIDPERAERVGGKAFVEDLRAEKMCEVSVGALVRAYAEQGEFNGRKYKAAWAEAQGDHLAFLPGGRGACSVEMGCGSHRAAMHLVTAEGLELENLGDVPGHPFYGNQWTESGGGKHSLAQLGIVSGHGTYGEHVFSVTVQDTKNPSITHQFDKKTSRDAKGNFTVDPSSDWKHTVSFKRIWRDYQEHPDFKEFKGTGKVSKGVAEKLNKVTTSFLNSRERYSKSLKDLEEGATFETLGDVTGHEFHGNQYTDGGSKQSEQSKNTGASLERKGFKGYKKGDRLAHDPNNLKPIRDDETVYIREFNTEKEAEESQDRFDYFKHPGAKMSSVSGPQKSNNFYPKWIHEVRVKHMAALDPIGLTTHLRTLMPRGWGDDEVKQEVGAALVAVEPALHQHGTILRVTNNSVIYALYLPMTESYGYPVPMTYWQRDISYNNETQTYTVSANKQQVEPTTVYVPLKTASSRVLHEGGRWVVYSTDGKRRLGEHYTQKQAEEHVSAIAARMGAS